jgi:hypothetical protein
MTFTHQSRGQTEKELCEASAGVLATVGGRQFLKKDTE